MIEKVLDPLPQPVRLMLMPWLTNFFPQADAALVAICALLAQHQDQAVADLLRKWLQESGWYDFDQHVTPDRSGGQDGIG